MGNQNKGNLEKYKAAHWRGIPDRSRGPKKAPASKFKREFARWLDKAPDLTPTEKRVTGVGSDRDRRQPESAPTISAMRPIPAVTMKALALRSRLPTV